MRFEITCKALRFAALGLMLAVAAVGCKESGPAGESNGSAMNGSVSTSATGSNATIDPATAGTISGTVKFKGAPPELIKIDMAQDPACQFASTAPNYAEQFVVHDGRLANVYLYIKDGLGNRVYAPPATPVVLDQKGCRYVPHVLAVMQGQPIEVHNDDPTMHNVHPSPTVSGNKEWDISQAPHGEAVTKSFAAAEVMLPVRCNNHPWMNAFLNVAPNPFYAVSDVDGHFEIKGLPAGTYTLAAVHEKLGEQDTTVEVKSQATAKAEFTYLAK